jgi:hypothetical protein
MMNIDNFSLTTTQPIHLAFDPNTLEALIRDGKLHVSDFNCLDKPSQKGVWAMLRSVAASTLRLS